MWGRFQACTIYCTGITSCGNNLLDKNTCMPQGRLHVSCCFTALSCPLVLLLAALLAAARGGGVKWRGCAGPWPLPLRHLTPCSALPLEVGPSRSKVGVGCRSVLNSNGLCFSVRLRHTTLCGTLAWGAGPSRSRGSSEAKYGFIAL